MSKSTTTVDPAEPSGEAALGSATRKAGNEVSIRTEEVDVRQPGPNSPAAHMHLPAWW